MKKAENLKKNALFLLHNNVLNTDQHEKLLKQIDENPNEAKRVIKLKLEEVKPNV